MKQPDCQDAARHTGHKKAGIMIFTGISALQFIAETNRLVVIQPVDAGMCDQASASKVLRFFNSNHN